MVACTTDFDLPYQEGTDRPCDLPEIWCRFADLVEAQLLVVENIVNRTAVGVPFAKVTKTSTTTYPIPALPGTDMFAVQFDSVVVDNDNMVDLSSDPLHVFVKRPGIYQVDAVIVASTSVVATMIVGDAVPTMNSGGVYDHDINVYWRQDSAYIHEFMLVNIPTAAFVGPELPFFGLNTGTGTGPNADLIVTAADMTVTWVAEEST